MSKLCQWELFYFLTLRKRVFFAPCLSTLLPPRTQLLILRLELFALELTTPDVLLLPSPPSSKSLSLAAYCMRLFFPWTLPLSWIFFSSSFSFLNMNFLESPVHCSLIVFVIQERSSFHSISSSLPISNLTENHPPSFQRGINSFTPLTFHPAYLALYLVLSLHHHSDFNHPSVSHPCVLQC